MARTKAPTATEWIDGTVYGIWDRAYVAQPGDLEEDYPLDAAGMFEGLVDYGLSKDDIDLSRVPGWIQQLRESEACIRHRRLQLEALLSERTCPSCGAPVAGRTDRVYCSAACRVRHHRDTRANT